MNKIFRFRRIDLIYGFIGLSEFYWVEFIHAADKVALTQQEKDVGKSSMTCCAIPVLHVLFLVDAVAPANVFLYTVVIMFLVLLLSTQLALTECLIFYMSCVLRAMCNLKGSCPMVSHEIIRLFECIYLPDVFH